MCLSELGFPETPTSCPLMDVHFRESMIFIKMPLFVVPPWWRNEHGAEAWVHMGNLQSCCTFLPTYPHPPQAPAQCRQLLPPASPAQRMVAVTSLGGATARDINLVNTNGSSAQIALWVPPNTQWGKPLPTLGALLLQAQQGILAGKYLHKSQGKNAIEK